MHAFLSTLSLRACSAGHARSLGRLGALAVFTLCSIHAHAQQSPPTPPPAVSERDQQARKLFEQGREAYGDGRYRDAWAYFHQAYQLSGRPELLFNIGQTADRLGQEADAVQAFSMYVERLPAAPNRKDVENRIHALQERIASAQQASAPAPAAAPPTRPAVSSQPSSTAAAAGASRQPAAPASRAKPERAREPRRGFFLRAAIGGGYRSDSIEQTVNTGFLESETYKFELDGYGLSLDVALGWSVVPGLVIGAGLFLDHVGSPSLVEDGTYETKLASANLTSLGPIVAWYPVRKTLGWHILAGFGGAVLGYKNTSDNEDGIDGTAFGISFVLGTGYELNLSATTAIGVELRFLGAALGELVSDETTSHGVTSPSLLISFTWF